MNDYFNDNQAWWDEVTPVHEKTYGNLFVGIDEFLGGKTTLEPLELEEMGPVPGKSLLHLQCHFGLDTLSWVREGASVTGIDFSEKSIQLAQNIAEQAKLPAKFIQSNIYDLPNVLKQQFDIVYTSRGVLNWLPDLEKWAEIIHRYLKPGSMFYTMELHPMLFVLDETRSGEIELKYPYFSTGEPLVSEADETDYADHSFIPKSRTWEWSWSVGDVVSALSGVGLHIEFLHEFPWTFYKALPGMVETEPMRWVIPGKEKHLPLCYTLRATRNK